MVAGSSTTLANHARAGQRFICVQGAGPGINFAAISGGWTSYAPGSYMPRKNPADGNRNAGIVSAIHQLVHPTVVVISYGMKPSLSTRIWCASRRDSLTKRGVTPALDPSTVTFA